MRIMLADDQKDVRSGLRALLEQEAGLSVVGEASEIGSLVARAKEISPDLILLDWELTNLKISDVIPVLRQLCPSLKIIALSSRPEAAKSALGSGADAFVSKGDHPEKLLDAIRDIGKEL